MKKFAILSVTFIFVALLSVAASAQEASKSDAKKDSALLASWEVTFSAPGQDVPGTFKLEKDGDNFKGIVSTALGDSPLKNIKIKDDNTFTADISVNAQGQTFDGTMTGKLEGDKLSGALNLSGLGEIPYSGKKAEKQ